MNGLMRVGMGYDVHKLTEDRDLILGGVNIPWEKGLLGHSDADVLIHAIMDALLGAAALRDIGRSSRRYRKTFSGHRSGIQRNFQCEAPGACGRTFEGERLCSRKHRCNHHCPEAEDGTAYSKDEKEYCRGTWN